MELDRYGAVLRRRVGLIIAIVLLTALVSGVYAILVPTGYKATSQLLVDPIAPQSGAATYYYPPYYQEQAAQYILDDFIGVIEGTSFSEQVIKRLQQSPQADVRAAAAKMTTVDDAQQLSKQFTMNRINRLLQIQVQAKSRNEALAIQQAADQIIVQEGGAFFAQLNAGGAGTPGTAGAAAAKQFTAVHVTVSDEPHIIQKPSKVHAALFWLLRTAVGFVAALAIVLVLHYFDDRLYDEHDVQDLLGLPVLGTVDAPHPAASAAARHAVPARERVTAGERS